MFSLDYLLMVLVGGAAVPLAAALFVGRFRGFLRANALNCAAALLVTVVVRLPVEGRQFMGQEYEDSYVYTAAARTLQESPPNKLGVTLCILGSLDDCQHRASYGGHLVGLPAVASIVTRVFGYDPYVICGINFAASLGLATLVLLLATHLTRSPLAGLTAGLVFAATPAMGVFTTTASAETLSSLFSFVFLTLFILFFRDGDRWPVVLRSAISVGMLCAVLLALVTKRENLALLALAITYLLVAGARRAETRGTLLLWLVVFLLVACAFVYLSDVVQVEGNESAEIGAGTFAWTNFWVLAPIFVKAMLSFKWFLVTTPAVLVGLCVAARPQHRSLGLGAVAVVMLVYLGAYVTHYRSYYQVVHQLVTPDAALRYLTNLFPYYCVLAGAGMVESFNRFRRVIHVGRSRDILITAFLAVMVMYGTYSARSLKREWSREELELRIKPVLTAVRVVGDSPIVTDVPILFQVFASEQTPIVDAPSIGTLLRPSDVDHAIEHAGGGYWLRNRSSASEIERSRYPGAWLYLDALALGPPVTLTESDVGFEIVPIQPR